MTTRRRLYTLRRLRAFTNAWGRPACAWRSVAGCDDLESAIVTAITAISFSGQRVAIFQGPRKVWDSANANKLRGGDAPSSEGTQFHPRKGIPPPK